jgi:MSHA biogenesis protein MshO
VKGVIADRGSMQPKAGLRYGSGFTLVELVVAITIAGVVAVFVVFFLSAPVESYFAQSSRADLADSEDRILRALAADVRVALPGSIRGTPIAGGGYAVEMLITTGVARYYGLGEKAYLSPPQQTVQELWTGVLDTDGFYTLNHFGAVTGNYLAVTYPGAPSAYALTGIMASQFAITPDATLDEDQISLGGGGFNFSGDSPTHRVFLVSGPVTYLCDTNARVLRRYANYSITSSQPANASTAPLSAVPVSLIANNVTSCTLSPVQPPGTHVGQLLRVNITLSSGGSPTVPNSSEVMQVFHEISTRYSP